MHGIPPMAYFLTHSLYNLILLLNFMVRKTFLLVLQFHFQNNAIPMKKKNTVYQIRQESSQTCSIIIERHDL